MSSLTDGNTMSAADVGRERSVHIYQPAATSDQTDSGRTALDSAPTDFTTDPYAEERLAALQPRCGYCRATHTDPGKHEDELCEDCTNFFAPHSSR